MNENPFIGVALHALGGVGHGSFYAPLKKVRAWAWESAWLIQGVVAWVLTPWLAAWLTGSHPIDSLLQTAPRSLLLTYVFGAVWGAGSLTFGLSMRYLGMSLGQAVALGYTVALGTLIPPFLDGKLASIIGNQGGRMVLAGVGCCLIGILLCGIAGMRRERGSKPQGSSGARSKTGLGFLVASFSGIMSSGFALGIQSGEPIAQTALEHGAPVIFQKCPVFIVVMAGGFTVNLIWCLFLGFKNRSTGDYSGKISQRRRDWNSSGAGESLPTGFLKTNYLWASVAGVTWYAGFFLYGMGSTFMGRYDFTSWSIHLALVIVFSTLCGVLAREWRGVGRLTAWLVGIGMFVLVSSTLVIALGNRVAAASH